MENLNDYALDRMLSGKEGIAAQELAKAELYRRASRNAKWKQNDIQLQINNVKAEVLAILEIIAEESSKNENRHLDAEDTDVVYERLDKILDALTNIKL